MPFLPVPTCLETWRSFKMPITLLQRLFFGVLHLDSRSTPDLEFRWHFSWQVDKLRSTKSKFVDNYTSGVGGRGPSELCWPVSRPGQTWGTNDQLSCPVGSPEEFLMRLNLMISQKQALRSSCELLRKKDPKRFKPEPSLNLLWTSGTFRNLQEFRNLQKLKQKLITDGRTDGH